MSTLASEIEYLEARIAELEAENAWLSAKLDNTKKLSPRDVRRMREMYRNGGYTQAELADIFDVNPATVSRTVRNIYH